MFGYYLKAISLLQCIDFCCSNPLSMFTHLNYNQMYVIQGMLCKKETKRS